MDQGDFDRALERLAEAERICGEAGNEHELLQVLVNVTAVHLKRNDFPRALDSLRREEQLASALNDTQKRDKCGVGIVACLAVLADHYADNRQFDQAHPYYLELATRARARGDHEYLRRSLAGQASVLSEMGNVGEALAKLVDVEELDRRSGDRRQLASGLMAQVEVLLKAGGDMQKAGAKAQEAAAIFEELNMQLDAAQAQALLLRIRSGLAERGVRVVGILVMLLLGAGGVALGLWKPWLWVVRGPLVLFAFANIILALVPSLQRRYNDYVRNLMSGRGGGL
jgi:tetratricopeptide (TPR) repeat protein